MSYAFKAEPYRRRGCRDRCIRDPLEKRFYGLRELAVADPDGHVITFAQP